MLGIAKDGDDLRCRFAVNEDVGEFRGLIGVGAQLAAKELDVACGSCWIVRSHGGLGWCRRGSAR